VCDERFYVYGGTSRKSANEKCVDVCVCVYVCVCVCVMCVKEC